jgi:hypothetical protein
MPYKTAGNNNGQLEYHGPPQQFVPQQFHYQHPSYAEMGTNANVPEMQGSRFNEGIQRFEVRG